MHPEEGDELRFVGLWTVDFVSKTLALASGVWTCRAARRLLDTTQRVRTTDDRRAWSCKTLCTTALPMPALVVGGTGNDPGAPERVATVATRTD